MNTFSRVVSVSVLLTAAGLAHASPQVFNSNQLLVSTITTSIPVTVEPVVISLDPNVIAGPGLPAIPEPSTWAMMSLGLAALVWRARRT